MDKIDVVLCQTLLTKSRTSYRELADKLNLSVTAVHNRIQTLIDMGVIRRFAARPSVLVQNAFHTLIFGSTKADNIRNLIPKLNAHGSIYWLAVAGGNILYIGAFLKNIGELEELVGYVKENAQIPEPTVGITNSPLPPNIINLNAETDLCELDYKIINSLKDDSRKPVADVAEEIGVSAKTVRRRLDRMTKNFLIELSIDWFPDASNDIISAFHVQLKPDADKNLPNMILGKNYPSTLFYWGFSNLPNSYFFITWSPTSRDVKDLREKIEQEPGVQSVAPNIIFTGYIFPTWRDKNL
ncbi:MAG: winged helix-turn-helix transcriptional regulator [Candidatus Bathyarchaeia archaeon]